MNEIDYAARVAKGAALLDEKRPGWEHEIDLDILNISSGYTCVTAQLSGVQSYHVGREQLDLTPGDDGTYVAHGFNAESCDDDCGGEGGCGGTQAKAYATLNALWKSLITTRLAAPAEPAA